MTNERERFARCLTFVCRAGVAVLGAARDIITDGPGTIAPVNFVMDSDDVCSAPAGWCDLIGAALLRSGRPSTKRRRARSRSNVIDGVIACRHWTCQGHVERLDFPRETLLGLFTRPPLSG